MAEKPENYAKFASMVAISLACCKALLFIYSGSLIVALSALDSLVDTLISFINMKVIRFSHTKADEDHPYGHGKAESLASLAQGSLIIGGAIGILVSSFLEMFKAFNTELPATSTSLFSPLFFLIAAFASFVLSAFLAKKGEQFRSIALKADALHYRSDVWNNFGSAIAIFIVYVTNLIYFDHIIAGFFSAVVIFQSIDLFKNSIDELMDKELSEDIKSHCIDKILKRDERIIDVHKFRGRKSGPHTYIDCHLTLPAHLSFHEVHEIIEDIEDGISKEINADLIIHADPHPLSSVE